jgi:hypothetical protein
MIPPRAGRYHGLARPHLQNPQGVTHARYTPRTSSRGLGGRDLGTGLATVDHVRFATLILLAVLATGCDGLDCFDDGPLEQAYRDGEARAQIDNATEFERGKQAGLALTFADGERDGAADGYADGFSTGYAIGYGAGFFDGHVAGSGDGARDPAACAATATPGANRRRRSRSHTERASHRACTR